MSDIIDTSFVVPYSTADVYGIGVAGPAAPENAPAQPEAQAEVRNANNTKKNEYGELGRYVDVKV